MVAPLTGAIKLTKAGKLRILVVPTAERNAVIPDVPTAHELGYDAELDLFRGLSVPPGTPSAIKGCPCKCHAPGGAVRRLYGIS